MEALIVIAIIIIVGLVIYGLYRYDKSQEYEKAVKRESGIWLDKISAMNILKDSSWLLMNESMRDLAMSGIGSSELSDEDLNILLNDAASSGDPDVKILAADECILRKSSIYLMFAAANYRDAAMVGNAEAQMKLGYCYRNGIGVGRDMREAKKWFQRAADQGNEEAIKALKYF